MIKVLAVDFSGVYFSWDWQAYWEELAELADLPVDEVKALPSRIREYQINKISNKEFWDHFCQAIGKAIQHNKLNAVVERQFKPVPHVIDHLNMLRAKHKIVLFTNHTGLLDNLDAKYGFYKNFDHVINSFEVGIQKPDKEIFDLLLSRTGTSPEEVLVIDDTELNIAAAKNLGFKTLLFTKNTDLSKVLSII